MRQFVRVFIFIVLSGALPAAGYTNEALGKASYEKRDVNNHVIHIVTIAPDTYEVALVKSNDGAIGRETVSSIAKRTHADIAINGGFFEIGAERDGTPSGTLVIAGHVYAIKERVQSLFVIDEKNICIEQANPHKYALEALAKLQFREKLALSAADSIFEKSPTPSSMSDFSKIESAPKSSNFSTKASFAKASLKNISMLSSIPLLLCDGTIAPDIAEKTSEFYTTAHARTAIGIKPDESIVVVVAEHAYKRDITAISMGEVQSLVKEKGHLYIQKYKHQSADEITLKELKHILREEFAIPSGTQGLTMVELAQLMKDLGCRHALNLDGGCSSALCLEGVVINHTIGEAEEVGGLKIERPVSDAIIFKRK